MRKLFGMGAAIVVLAFQPSGSTRAESYKGGYVYASASACAASGKFSAQICGFAEKNAAAEFEEKAPRFPTRTACEQALRGACAIGFRDAGGWSGRKGAIYFTARQQGFRVNAVPGRDVTVIPLAAGLAFSTRSAQRLDVAISPQAARYWSGAGRTASPGGGVFGVSTPEGAKGDVPPPPPVDPNFDCAAVLEPAAGGDPNTGCAPVPLRRH